MKISKQYFNASQMTDSNSLANALLQAPAELSPAITYLGGREDKKFPLSMLTEGVKNVISINRDEYEYKVFAKITHSRALAETVGGGSALGKGGSIFHLPFEDRWFINQYTLVSQNGLQVRIMGQPIQDGVNRYLYPVQILDWDPDTEFPSEDLVAGARFAQMYAPVGRDFSRGNASNWSAPSKVRHKLTTLRKSYEFSGRAKNFVVEFELPKKGGGSSKFWMDFEEWQYFLQWKTESEMYYWYGRQSYTEAGIAQMKDENGQPVIVGPGLLQQIENKDSYAELTVNKLKNTLRDLFYGMSDAQNVQVTLYTGLGGKEAFHNALMNEAKGSGFTIVDDGKFIAGEGRALRLTGYFTTYDHIDGHSVKVVTSPLFDHGPVAEVREKHPVTGLSLESYRMVFVDTSNYDGEPNLVMVNEEGREQLRWCVPGSIVPRGFDQSTSRASDIDGASVHWLKTAGICLRRPETSLDMECII